MKHQRFFSRTGIAVLCLAILSLPALAQSRDRQLRIIPPQAAQGSVSPDETDRAQLGKAVSQIARQLGGVGKFRVRGDKRGANQTRTLHSDQEVNGLTVHGAGLVINLDKAGRVRRISGGITDKMDLPRAAAVNSQVAEATALAAREGSALLGGSPEKVYVVDASGQVVLAWKIMVAYEDERGPQEDAVFVDATSGDVAAIHPQFHYAMTLETRDCQESTSNCVLVSTSTNSINTGDLAIDSAHNYARATYLYYANQHGRDSMDDNGMPMRSRVHYDRNYNNAFWDGYQMTYGDGDGTTFVPLSQDADVVAHELTHGVTDFTSNLIYSNESGALNEAFSDIFGAMVDRQEGATGADIWLIGEDIYTPNTPGDALRNMADPVAANDYDYYPTRYVGSQDNGGVHWNSGIANLAFVLLVEGGTHPRGKTSVVVPPLGFDVAADIFYRANTQCLTASSNFEAARNCTADWAAALYSQAEVDAVQLAWDAVGVPGGPPDPNAVMALDESNLSGSTGSERRYQVDVPEGATNLRIEISGGSGDADLYVRYGAEPTTATYDCRPYLNGNSEACEEATPTAGTYYIMVRAYSAYSSVRLRASYIGTGEPQNQAPVAGFNWLASGLDASFSDTSTDSDGVVSAWAWDFGDSATSSEQSPTHTYNSSGTYNVSLTVTDDQSATSAPATQAVTVLLDADGDGVGDEADLCPNTPESETADSYGCASSQRSLVVAVSQASLDGAQGSERNFQVEVPAGATDLRFVMSGGSGDADLYTRRGSPPTTSAYDCRPYSAGNDETCSEAAPAEDTYHAMIRGYSSYSGVEFTISYQGIGAEPVDTDGDGVPDQTDQCPNTPTGESVDGAGCSESQLDDDNDGVFNNVDQCPNTPSSESADADGCSDSQRDDDGDGVLNGVDACPNTPPGESVDGAGCSQSQLDDDNDGVFNNVDQCPNTPSSESAAADGCSDSQRDDDGDGVLNGVDACPNTPSGESVDGAGCSESQLDDDNDGVFNNVDQCPNTPSSESADANGCSDSQRDDDGDGVLNGVDACPNTPSGESVDGAGCSESQLDGDSDGVANNVDQCPNTPSGESVDGAGCSQSQLDDDSDGVANDVDQCPNTPAGDEVDATGCTVQPPVANVVLTVDLNRKGTTARLRWTGAESSRVRVLRNGEQINRTRNDGAWNDKGYTPGDSYEVCEDDLSVCSNPASP